MELLVCPVCSGELILKPSLIKPVLNYEKTIKTFECSSCFRTEGRNCELCIQEEIVEGDISCSKCSCQWRIEHAVPRFYGEACPNPSRSYSFYQEKLGGINKRDPNNLWGLLIPETLPRDFFKECLVLDAGCGDALFDLTLNSLQHAEIVAFDIDPVIYTIPERFDANMHFVRASIEAPPFRVRRFDFVYSVYVLHYLKDMWLNMEKTEGFVKQGGRFTLSLYPRRSHLVESIGKSLRKILVPLPKKIRRIILLSMSPFVNLVGSMSGVSVTKDGFSRCADLLEEFFGPKFLHSISQKELENWFNQKGYSGLSSLIHPVTVSGCKGKVA